MSGHVLLQQLSSLRSERLYSSLEVLSGFLMTVLKNSSDMFTVANQYEILVSYALAKLKSKQYVAAAAVFKQALSIRKSGLKQKGMAPAFAKLPSEAYVKYKLHLCYEATDNIQLAVNVLESIPTKTRSVKVHLVLGNLYQRLGLSRSAITCYKDVLKKNPLAFDAIFALLSLGENVNEVIPMLSSVTQGSDWILNLIKGYALMQNKEYSKGYSLLDMANRNTSISGNVRLQCELANLRVKTGNNRSAIAHFEKARMLDAHLLDGMDVYAFLLYEENDLTKLEKLASELFSMTELHPAPWVALGYRALGRHDHKRAVYLAVQATKMNRLCLQAMVLKGCALRAIDEQTDALAHFGEASRLDPTKFLCYKELVDTYLSMMRQNEALATAQSALKAIGCQPNCLVLYAKVQMSMENAKDKALRNVNKALSMEPNNQYAILIKGEILVKLKKLEEAVKFLSKCVENHSNSQMHSLLGNCYQELSDYSKAMGHYTVALSLDPENKAAEDGISAMSNLQNVSTYEETDAADLSGQLGGGEDGNSDSDMMITE